MAGRTPAMESETIIKKAERTVMQRPIAMARFLPKESAITPEGISNSRLVI